MKEICFQFQDRFNWLALLHIRKDMNMHIDKAIDMFAAMHPRRMRMTNFLGEDQIRSRNYKGVYFIGINLRINLIKFKSSLNLVRKS